MSVVSTLSIASRFVAAEGPVAPMAAVVAAPSYLRTATLVVAPPAAPQAAMKRDEHTCTNWASGPLGRSTAPPGS